MMRLDKFLAETGNGTRTEVKNKIKKGMVTVNGTKISKPDWKVEEGKDQIFISGREVLYARYEYFMLYKPAGYVSATKDKREKTVLDLIRGNMKKDLFPVGRLDKDTEGLLLISNDGELAHRLLSPGHHVEKVYYARIQGKLSAKHVTAFGEGLDIGENKLTRPAKLQILSEGDISEAEITIYEGKFHQVKRMFEAVGMQVLYLKRLRMGSLVLDERLAVGEFRRLTESEIRELKG